MALFLLSRGVMTSPLSASLFMGVEPCPVTNFETSFYKASEEEFDFLVCNLSHPDCARLIFQLEEGTVPFTREDVVLNTAWASALVGKISPFPSDSEDLITKKKAEETLLQEISFASHLGIPALLYPFLKGTYNNYARVLHGALSKFKGQNWLRVPMAPSEPEQNEGETWAWWNSIRVLTEHNSKLCVALEVTEDLPSVKIIKKWFGEPISALIVPTSIFLTNQKGYPTLSKPHQYCITKFFSLKLQYILSGDSSYPNGYTNYKKYIRHLIESMQPPTPQEAFESPFYDYLQAPLQPLKDNLQSQTYEVFEKDPVKYARYQEAVRLALLERKDLERSVVLMVVGAGRGPLISCSLRAAEQVNHTKVKIYAVEKNPNAVVTLKNKKIYYGWGDRVMIVDCDMRVWEAPEKADILVSELLGSFGDNELSPECLDGAQRFLKEDGISIPENYISYISPVTAPKLWSNVQAYKDLEYFETSFVVKVHNAFVIAPPQTVFTFHHPNRDEVIDNSRSCDLVFKAEADTLMHGFVGYFSSKLFGDVEISIHPDSFSEGMFSWFPVYFPLRTPISVKEGEDIHFHMFRVCQKEKVWYEWSVTAPTVSAIHNPGGRSHWIGL